MKRTLALIITLSVVLSLLFSCSIDAYAKTYRDKESEFYVSVSNMSLPTVLKKKESFRLVGKLKGNYKIKRINISVKDLNQFKSDFSVSRKNNSKSVNLKGIVKGKRFSKLSSGEKELIITATDFNGNNVKIKRTFTVLGKAKEPYHITKKCKITSSKGNYKNVLDNNENTYWSSGKLIINIPDNVLIDGLYLSWHRHSNDYTITSYSADGEILDTVKSENERHFLNKYYTLNEAAKRIIIRLSRDDSSNKGIATLRLYEKDKVGVSVQKWESPKAGECELMVISSHRDDELLFMGGTIPYYQSVLNKNVYVMYMSGGDILRHREALAGQWSLGNHTYPIFMDFPGGYHDGIKGTLKSWGGENYVISELVNQIRKYKPDVIVTHDFNGEYGHPTHKTTPYVVLKAIKAAGNKNKYKDSYNYYGAWKVKKLYSHMYSKNKLVMKQYKKHYSVIDGKSAYQLACIGYDKHISQHGGWSMNSDVVRKYPSDRYGLVYSRVGKDKKHKSFFENID